MGRGGGPGWPCGSASRRLADAQTGLSLVVAVARIEDPVRGALWRRLAGGVTRRVQVVAVERAVIGLLGDESLISHGGCSFLSGSSGSGGWVVEVGGLSRWVGSGDEGGLETERTGKTKEPLPEEATLRRNQTMCCLLSPSRVPPVLPWHWKRVRPYCTRWIDPRWKPPYPGRPGEPNPRSLPLGPSGQPRCARLPS